MCFHGFPKMDTEDMCSLKIYVYNISTAQEVFESTLQALQVKFKIYFFSHSEDKKNPPLLPLWTACLHDLSIRGGVLLSSCLYSSLVYFCNNWAGRGLAWGTKTDYNCSIKPCSSSDTAPRAEKRALKIKKLCTLVWMNGCFSNSGQIKTYHWSIVFYFLNKKIHSYKSVCLEKLSNSGLLCLQV